MDATMFHFLEPLLMDLYNAKAKTKDAKKQKVITEWIDTLSSNPTAEEFKKILVAVKEL